MTTARDQTHYHCVTCGKRIAPQHDKVNMALLVCDDNERCYHETPPRYRRWNGYKYVPDTSRAEPCDDDCGAEPRSDDANGNEGPELTSIIDGIYGDRGEPILEARLYLSDSLERGAIRMLVSTGTPQSLICAKDWKSAGVEAERLRWHKIVSTLHTAVRVSDEVTAVFTLTDRKGAVHHRTMPVRLLAEGHGRQSMAGIDLLRSSALTMEPYRGVLTIELPGGGTLQQEADARTKK